MQEFDGKYGIHNILKEFKTLDEHYLALRKNIMHSIIVLVKRHYPDFIVNEKNTEYLELFSTYLINAIDTIIDKDNNYPDYRLAEEVKAMQRLARIDAIGSVNKKFEDEFEKTVKSFVTDSFQKIYDLTGNGFRLLEANIVIYNHHFFSDFYLDDYFYQ